MFIQVNFTKKKKKKKVLVIGGLGYIGSILVKDLLDKKISVNILDKIITDVTLIKKL